MISLSAMPFFGFTQNLVPNPSFEDTITNPGSCLIADAEFWNSANAATPDYLMPYGCGGSSLIARSGSSCAGIFCYQFPFNNLREYIQVELTDTLIQGKSYCVEGYFMPAKVRYACNNVGFLFTDTEINQANLDYIPLIPQIENSVSNPLTDTLTWKRVSGSFIANGSEKFLIIGNFRDDNNIDTSLILPGYTNAAYTLIDDVSVTLCPDPTIPESTLFVPSAFSPNGDGNNDVLFVRGNNIIQMDFKVYDRWGEEVFTSNAPHIGWDGTYKGKELQSAVFMYYANITYADGKTEMVKGNVSLIK